MDLLKRLWKEEEGQGMVEYILILALISIVAIAAINLVGDKVSNVWNATENAIVVP